SAYITIFGRMGARRLFPCWDQPIFKATFNISVVHSSKVQVLSNMPYRNEMSSSGKNVAKVPTRRTKRTDFHITPVMSTYLVTIAIIGNVTNYTAENNIELYYTGDTGKHIQIVRKIVRTANVFLNTYTYHRCVNMTLRILSYRDLPSNAIGAWGFAVFRENDIIYKRIFDFPGRKFAIWKTVANQIARQCIESFVSPQTWTQQWFSRAFATYLSYKIAGKKEYDPDIMMQFFVVQVILPAMHNDKELKMPTLTDDYDPFYSSLIYKKACAMLMMLEIIATEEVLQDAFAQYMRKYAYGSATPFNFLRILELKMRALSEDHIDSFWEITRIMHIWFSQRRFPTLVAVQNDNDKSIDVTIDGSKETEWPLPIISEVPPRVHILLAPSMISIYDFVQNISTSFNIHGGGPDNFFIFNVRHFGYYRVYYDYDNWMKIAKHLNNEDHTKIHVLNRAQIIDDAYHFLMDGSFSYIIFYDLISYLQKETNFIVWHSMMNILHYSSPFFNIPESTFFKEHVIKIMRNLFTRIGYYEDPKDNEMLQATRLLLLNWACKHGHDKCRENAHNKLVAHIHDPENKPISQWWDDWIYCAGLMHVSNYTLPELLDILHTQKKDVLQYILCVDDDDLLQKQVEMFLYKHETAQDENVRLRKFYRNFVKRHARKPKVLDFILKNFDNILPGHMTIVEKITHIFMGVYSKCQLDKILQYVNQKANLNAEPTIKHWIIYRKEQINRLKESFSSRFHDHTPIKEC
ncbi:PREDICTED: aminopeptidase N-like, partial [Dinoponera quadriceps]|uniref:Aminopeptidase N-like n=1 Tax=Dinoponera quadriceps TaxID=609295 RepID=A0A6P3Y2D1_DINQU